MTIKTIDRENYYQLPDGVNIPKDKANRDYRKLLVDIGSGAVVVVQPTVDAKAEQIAKDRRWVRLKAELAVATAESKTDVVAQIAAEIAELEK